MPASSCASSLTLCDVGSADPVLHGTSDRRADLEQLHEGVRARKRPLQISLRIRSFRRSRAAMPPLVTTTIWPNQVFAVCTSNDSTKRGAPVPDISRPMLDAGISLQLLALEARHLRIGVGNRGVLRQVPVDDQLGRGPTRGKTAAARISCPNSDSAKAATVTPMVIQRWCMQTRRKR